MTQTEQESFGQSKPKGTLEVTLFTRPNATQKVIEMKEIYQEDVTYFQDNNIKVSIEEMSEDQITVYADTGHRVDDDSNEDPDEVIVFSNGRDCLTTMTELREQCVARLSQDRPRFASFELYVTPID